MRALGPRCDRVDGRLGVAFEVANERACDRRRERFAHVGALGEERLQIVRRDRAHFAQIRRRVSVKKIALSPRSDISCSTSWSSRRSSSPETVNLGSPSPPTRVLGINDTSGAAFAISSAEARFLSTFPVGAQARRSSMASCHESALMNCAKCASTTSVSMGMFTECSTSPMSSTEISWSFEVISSFRSVSPKFCASWAACARKCIRTIPSWRSAWSTQFTTSSS